MTRPKVLVFEPMHEAGIDHLRAAGCEVAFPDALDPATLLRAAADADAIIVRTSGQVTRELMEAAPRLRVVGRHGVGLETIDVGAATALGVQVVNTPLANAGSVAEHFVMLALMAARHAPRTTAALRAGDWAVRARLLGTDFGGKTVGVVGLGRIGQAIARICARGFECPVLYHSRTPRPEVEAELGIRSAPLRQLFEESDFVALALPFTPQTEGMIGAAELGWARPSAIIVNVSHGRVWDEQAVAAALREGRLASAASDVYAREPILMENSLLSLDNFVGTPHNASQTDESLRRMSMVSEDIVRVLRGEPPRHPVNEPAPRRAT